MLKKLLPKPRWLLMEQGYFTTQNLICPNLSKEEFQQPEFEGYEPKPSKSVNEDISNKIRESPNALLVKELVSYDKLEKKTVSPTVSKIEFVRPKQQEKPVWKPVKYAEMYRERVVSGNNYTRVNYNYSAKKAHPGAHRNMVPRAVLMKTGLRSLNTARPVKCSLCLWFVLSTGWVYFPCYFRGYANFYWQNSLRPIREVERNFTLLGASGRGPTKLIPHCMKGHAVVTEVMSCFGNLEIGEWIWHALLREFLKLLSLPAWDLHILAKGHGKTICKGFRRSFGNSEPLL
ncbi:hypothetical protein Tco_0520316 [Tanacetum coccineum]